MLTFEKVRQKYIRLSLAWLSGLLPLCAFKGFQTVLHNQICLNQFQLEYLSSRDV